MSLEITVLASSSSGNAYHLTDGKTPLLLEAGLGIDAIRKGVGFTVSSLAGALISHEHGDHARGVKDLLKVSVDVYASAGTFRALGIERHHRAKVIKARQQFSLGTWMILPFDTVHDAEEPLGFLLASGEDKLLYLTDTAYCRYTFRGLTHVMIEANYSAEILREAAESGAIDRAHKARVFRNHLSLERALDLLRANDLSRVQGIWLLHLSDRHSDEEAFRRAVARATGKPVYIASKRREGT